MATTNAELARLFRDMAAMLELTGANRFRVIAHDRVAQALKDLPDDVAKLVDDPARLEGIEGIGTKSAKKIIEYVRTGKITEYEELLDVVPEGLLEVRRIPGLGPKTVKLLWEQGGVTDLPSLQAALDAGTLESLPRMGAKTLENIRASIGFMSRAGRRTRIGKAMPIAEAIVERLRAVPGTERVEFTGSLRRGRETIGDLDVLASSTDPHGLSEVFRSMDGVEQILVAGDTKSSVRLAAGLQADLRVVDATAYGAALLYFTGSKPHNVALRERAIKRGYRLNEYGLFPDDGEETPPQQRGIAPVVSATEASIYEKLELPYIPPPLREDRGELAEPPPELIDVGDVRAELHAHTIASDGRLTIELLVAEAKRRGYDTIAITDHSRSSVQANGLSDDRLRTHIAAVRDVAAQTDGIRVLAGSEVDILTDGRLDYDDELLSELDIVVASPHAALTQDTEKATRRLLAAIEHPLVDIVGHPTGRVIGRRGGLEPDLPTLVAAAAEHDTALEVNANSRRLDLRDTHVRAVVEAGGLIAINTDAHGVEDFDQLRYGVLTAQRGWLTADRCINTWAPEAIGAWLARRRGVAAR
ncbi:MAG: DNA polymerase/3'-5' exonuclease PolX [Phycisphaerales bacterium]|nr:DNA polymerase/3'-5' exonuclease PolX [Phycisphaerales bacterium]